MKRERLGSRLGFILLSAGCAIGVGNVWKFPWMTGQYGGGAFVLIYLIFLVAMGIPIMTMEFAVGRASQKSPVKAFQAIEPKGTKWHLAAPFMVAGNYLLMMFYTMVTGWMLNYVYKFATGTFTGMTPDEVGGVFGAVCATMGVVLPSFVIILIVAKCYDAFRQSKVVKGCMSGLKPAVVALIAGAVISVGLTVFFPDGLSFGVFTQAKFYLAAAISAVMLVLAFKKAHPILIICLSAVIGIAGGFLGLQS